jgi:hypothetical protein
MPLHTLLCAAVQEGWTALMKAAKGGRASACEVLLARGADVRAVDRVPPRPCTRVHSKLMA